MLALRCGLLLHSRAPTPASSSVAICAPTTPFMPTAFYNGAYASVSGADNRLSNYYQMRARQNLNIDTRTATEYGVVRTFFDADFHLDARAPMSATAAATGRPSTRPVRPARPLALTSVNGLSNDGIAGGSLGVYYAFIQFAGFTMGKAVSQFDAPWNNYPGNNFDQLVGGGGRPPVSTSSPIPLTSARASRPRSRRRISRCTRPPTSGTPRSRRPAASLGGAYGGNTFGGNVAPDIVGMVRVDQAWGLFQASVAAHDNHAAYYGATEATGHPDDKWGWAGQLALSIKNIPTGPGDTINVQGVYTNGASRYNFQSLAPTSIRDVRQRWHRPRAYQSLGFAGVSRCGLRHRQSDMQLTTTYGFAWRLHAQLGSVLEHGAVRCLGCRQVQRHGQVADLQQRRCCSRLRTRRLHLQPGLQHFPGRRDHPLDPGQEPDLLGRRGLQPSRPEVLGPVISAGAANGVAKPAGYLPAQGPGHGQHAAARSAQLLILIV